MFFEIYEKLCKEKGLTPTGASVEIGFSRGSVSYWRKKYKEGIDAKPDSYTAARIADFFGVSVDYLLGRTVDRKHKQSISDESLVKRAIAEDKIDATIFLDTSGSMGSIHALETSEFSPTHIIKKASSSPTNDALVQQITLHCQKLDYSDLIKAESYIAGLLSADKYQSPTTTGILTSVQKVEPKPNAPFYIGKQKLTGLGFRRPTKGGSKHED